MKHSLSFVFLLLALSFVSVADAKQKKKKKEVRTEKEILQETDLYMEAARSKILGDYTRALSLFQEVITLNDNNAAAHYELASLYLGTNQKEKAETTAEAAMKLDPKNKWYRALYVEILASNGKYEKAATLYEDIVKEDPRNVENYVEWAYMLVNAQKLKEALEVYNKVEKMIGINEDIILEKQKIYLKLDDINGAVEEIKKLMKEFPLEPRYALMLGELYLSNDKTKEAKAVYSDLLIREPNNPFASMALASIYKKEGDTLHYNQIVRLIMQDPNAELDAKIAFLYTAIQNFSRLSKDEKQQFINLSLMVVNAHEKSAKANAMMADFYYLNEESKNALTYYKKSLALQKDVYIVWQQLFSMLLEEKNYQELIDSTTKAIELYPNQATVYYFNGLGNYHLKNQELAIKRLLKCAALAGDNNSLKAQVYALVGDIYSEQKNHEESDHAYEESLTYDPKNAYTLNNYAYHLSVRGKKLDKAEEMSKKSLEINPNSSSFLDTYAWILFKQGKYKEALAYQEKALAAENSDRTTLFEHYGDILYFLNEKEKALEYWKKALDAGSASPTLKKKIGEKKYYSEDIP